MTYMKCTCKSVMVYALAFWSAALVATAFVSPMFMIPLGLLAMFHFTYLNLSRMPVPIVLSFVSMVSLSFYAVYMNTASFS
jgi:hypothetical protein